MRLVRSFPYICIELSHLILFRRANIVEYSRQINEDDPRDVEMVQASNECRIAVVRKRVTDPESRQVRVVTSVWAFSDDGATRVELRMDDTQMYIPYASYFSPCKVSITLPCELKFHDIKHGNRPLRVAKTTWVNYVFNSSQGTTIALAYPSLSRVHTDLIR